MLLRMTEMRSIEEELKHQEDLCPLEKMKIWTTGFSIKCPESTVIIYIKDDDKPRILGDIILSKRSSSLCIDCEKA